MDTKVKISNNNQNGSYYMYHEPHRFKKDEMLLVRLVNKREVKLHDGTSFFVIEAIDLLSNKRISFTNTFIVKNYYFFMEKIVKIICTNVESREIDDKTVEVPQLIIETVNLVYNDAVNMIEIR